jgi:hypothetical protein
MLPDRSSNHDCAAADDGPIPDEAQMAADDAKTKRQEAIEAIRAKYTPTQIRAILRAKGHKIPRGPNFMKAKRRK